MNTNRQIELSKEICDLHATGKYKIREIAVKMGISWTYLWDILKKQHIKLENNSLLHKLAGFKTKEEFLNRVRELYNKPLTIEQVAEEMKINHRALQAHMQRNGFEARDGSEAIGVLATQRDFELTKEETEVINGLLLGDGHIEFQKSKHVYAAKLVYTCKHKSVLEGLAKQLQRLKPRIFYKTYKSKGKVRHGYRLATNKYKFLLELRHKWYPNGKKIVPEDLKLTPETCYWWYLGDGMSGNSQIFCTHSFTIAEVDRLISMLPVHARRYMVICRKTGIKSFPTIVIGRINDRIDFFDYIGSCRHEVYAYKWILGSNTKKRTIEEAKQRRAKGLYIFGKDSLEVGRTTEKEVLFVATVKSVDLGDVSSSPCARKSAPYECQALDDTV
jgi:predicted DNA-binding protein YlxM (UPF0122 family)